jgi:hypothetical protein
MLSNQQMMLLAVGVLGGYLYYSSRNKNSNYKSVAGAGKWGITHCKQPCKDLCENFWKGEYLPDAGNYGGCFCQGCGLSARWGR